jgi:hypothetical protein
MTNKAMSLLFTQASSIFQRLGALMLLGVIPLLAAPWLGPWALFGSTLVVALGLAFRIHGFTLVEWLFGLIGPPSVALLTLLGGASGAQLELWPLAALSPLMIILAALGLILYPPVLGLVRFDPTRIGYSGAVIRLLGAGLAGVALALSAHSVVIWLILFLAVGILRLHPSRNAVDHLIDPLASLLALLLFLGMLFT